jgi:AI-2 transport protein TqsA
VAEKAPDFQEIYGTAKQWTARVGLSLPELPGRNATATEGSGQFTTLLEKLATAALGMFASAWQTLAIAILVFFFTLLMLLEARSWRARLANAVGNHRAEALDAVDMTARKIREYIWVRTIVSLISGSLAGLWFCIVGVDLWYLWGFLFFALNYIPFVGTLIAGIPPILMALAEGGWTMGLLALAGVIATESIVENFLDPKLQGDRLSVSPVVLLAGVAFLGWAWSWPGIFLAIPLTATLVVVLAHTERLKPLALLLSNSPRVAELERRTHANAQTTDSPAPAGSSTSTIPASLR